MPLCPIDNPAPYLPHSGKMVLLSSIVSYDEHGLHATAHVGPEHILLPQGEDALPVYLGAEIMAQGIAAWAGLHAADRGEPVRLGFLLGTRKLVFGTDYIPIGTHLDIYVRQSWQDGSGMGVFDCEMRCRQPENGADGTMPAGMLLLHGSLNVFCPQNDGELDKILQSEA